RVDSDELVADSEAAAGQFAKTACRQVDLWARGWLSAGRWFDGRGIPDAHEVDAVSQLRSGRQVVAWALGCLARAGDHWYELDTFISELHALQNHLNIHL